MTRSGEDNPSEIERDDEDEEFAWDAKSVRVNEKKVVGAAANSTLTLVLTVSRHKVLKLKPSLDFGGSTFNRHEMAAAKTLIDRL